MSNNLYDTGAPTKIIVEHRHSEPVPVHICPNCAQATRTIPCERCGFDKPRRQRIIDITPELPETPERKRLK